MNEKLIITRTLILIDSKPPITRSERFFDLVVCLHLLSQNRYQNANMSELWHTFVGWWKVTRKPLGHYHTERQKTERSWTSVHHCTDFWSLFVLPAVILTFSTHVNMLSEMITQTRPRPDWRTVIYAAPCRVVYLLLAWTVRHDKHTITLWSTCCSRSV